MINIVLYEPEIPQNCGNIMRTCVATNAKLHLIKPLGFRVDDATIKRSGVNYIESCDFNVYENIDDFYAKNKGEIYYLTRYGHKPHTEINCVDPNKDYFFVFGKESTGIPSALLKPHIDHCLRIPMSDKVRALNLSNTVAIVVYEALRQQGYPNLYLEEPHKSKNYIEEK